MNKDAPIHVTLEQARALDALDRAGTLVAAAAALHKGHTAVMYGLRQLEAQTGLALLDRRGYRLRLTAAGRRVLEHCRRLLEAEARLAAACHQLRTGWEPTVRVVYDGVCPDEPLLRAVGALVGERAPTRLHVSAAFLGGVEAAFERERADLMVSVLPAVAAEALVATRLPPLVATLVAARGHPLARTHRQVGDDELADEVLLTVHGSDPRLELPTAALERRATVDLNDFHAKRAALLAGLGYGWLPEHLCAAELRAGRLRRVRYHRGSEHRFAPRLYVRAGARPGPATRRLIDALVD
ncbi:MAG TPA: LysR family transcriptional regulator [Kofleriaceae bacterium]|nr:LysR family transcriptional regulator [Kofleriaceae bacterium]